MESVFLNLGLDQMILVVSSNLVFYNSIIIFIYIFL